MGYSPLGLGVLSGKYSPDRLPDGPRGLIFKALLPSCTPLIAELNAIAAARGVSCSAVAINWAMSKGGVWRPACRSRSSQPRPHSHQLSPPRGADHRTHAGPTRCGVAVAPPPLRALPAPREPCTNPRGSCRRTVLVIVGMKTPEQVADNLQALTFTLSTSEIDELERAARGAKQATQNIFQTR